MYDVKGWNGNSINTNNYFTFTLTPKAGAKINFASFSFYYTSANGNGPTMLAFRSSTDGFATDITTLTITRGNTSNATISLSAAAYQNVTVPITFRFYCWGGNGSGGKFSINDFMFNGTVSPVIAKNYRSRASGDWTSLNTWESQTGATWALATLIPTASDNTITIRAGHTVGVSTSISLDETTINANAVLSVATNGILNINNGTGNDIVINNGGILQVVSNNTYATAIFPAASSSINVATGGKIQVGNGIIAVGAGYEAFGTGSLVIWNDKSIFEWDTPVNLPFGNSMATSVFFPGATPTIIPRLKINTVASPVGGSIDVTVNGLLQVGTNFTLGSTGNKTIRDGITGNSTLSIVAPSLGNTITISGTSTTTPILGGTNLIIATDKNINIPNGITVPSDSIVKIMPITSTFTPQFAKGANVNFTVSTNGTIDFTTTTVTNTSGAVVIDGYVKTANPGGLEGGAISASSNTQVNTGSTIEYNAASGTQTITGSGVLEGLGQYYNLVLSGGSTKTPANAVDVNTSGSVKITGATTVVDASSNNIGLTSTNNTSFTMDGGTLILGTSGSGSALPLMDGAYNITGGVIRYIYSGATTQTIRNKSYYAIEVMGSNVANSNGNITLIANGTFKVKTNGVFTINDNTITGPSGTASVTVERGGTFRTGNNEGFNGFVSALTNNSSIHQNITNINLLPGSIVEYLRAGDQPITNVNGLVYQNLLISGSGNKLAPAGTLTVQSQLLKTGTSTFLHNNGTVLLNGTGTQNFAGLTYNNLVLSSQIGFPNSNKITAGNSTITDSIKVNSSATLSISNNDTIALHSDAIKTARVGQLTGGAAINYGTNAKFTVERYISSKRAWRFLSVPTISTQSIKSQWQEGATSVTSNPKSGYGTQITDNNSNWAANGFDAYSQGGPSVKYYNPARNNYTGIASTNAAFDMSKGGLMTFVRGDRTAQGFGFPVTKTTLRTSGTLFSGVQPLIVPTNQFVSVNNPFASAIDLRKIFVSPNVFYYVWDPNRGGVGYGLGAFITLFWNSSTSNYETLPANLGSYGAVNNFIENGQAFFASTLGAPVTMQLNENSKSDATFPIAPFTPVGNTGQQLRTNLYDIAADGSTSLADGVLTNLDDNYNNALDGMDAFKLTNFGENLAIISNQQSLVVERRKTIYSNDTLFYKIWGLRPSTYRLKFIADQMNHSGVDAYVEDSYLQSRSLLDLNGTTDVDFTVDANTGSFAPDRFRIVFEAAAGPLPVSFTNVKAYRQMDDIAVEWKVENEINIKQYEVEKSNDGTLFTAGSIVAVQNTVSYNWIDLSPLPGSHYYRIKSVDINGKIQYSKIVQVLITERKPAITIYPNPVKGGVVHLHLVNQPAGHYGLRIINKSGQVMAVKEINHATNAGVNNIDIEFNAAQGIYDLEITMPDKTKISKKIIK